ncbi:aspartate--ammonia ligase [Mycoplasma anatis]|nr:aspartate--ammonia ligase [Mycoplasmopsis anatis]
MGIRVDKNSLLNQKEKLNKSDEYMKEYHQMILNNQLPFTIGGGIGQSRLSMFLLEKKHIAEVQVSLWDEQNNNFFEENNIEFL